MRDSTPQRGGSEGVTQRLGRLRLTGHEDPLPSIVDAISRGSRWSG